jgi:MFS transporter, DHA1 family, inner membrane transport protein
MTRKEIILLAVLSSINFTNIMDFMIMMPLQEFLEISFDITPKQFGFLVSAYAFSAFAASMTASFIVDRFDRKHTLLVAFTGLIAGTLACGLATSYEMLVSARIVAGLFGGLISAQGLAIVGDTFSYEKRGRAMGFMMSGFALASIAGVPLGLFIATKTDWQVPFIGIGILGIILLPVTWFVIPTMKSHINPEHNKNIFAVYQSVWKDRNQQLGLLMMLTLIFSHFATIPFIAPYLTKNTGFLLEQLPLMYFFGGALSLFTSPLIGKMADKYGKHKIFTIALLLSVIPVYLLTNLGKVPFYYVLAVTTLFFIVAGGRFVPAQALITSVVPPNLRGGFMNLNSSLQQLGLGLSSFIGGMIIAKGETGELLHYDIIGYISITISMVCLVVMRKVKAVD